MIKLTKLFISALRSKVFAVLERLFILGGPDAKFHCPLTKDVMVHHVVVVIARLQRGC